MAIRALSAPLRALRSAGRHGLPISTGFKLFVILSMALLPLGLVAFLAAVQSNRSEDLERQAQLRIALAESSRKLSAALASDIASMRGAITAASAQPDDATICTRLSAVLGADQAAMPRFALFGASATPVCASSGFRPRRPSTLSFLGQSDVVAAVGNDGLALAVDGGLQVGVLAYPPRTLAAIGRPGEFLQDYALALSQGSSQVTLVEPRVALGAGRHDGTDTLGIADLSIEMQIPRHPFSVSQILSLLLPFLMWLAAAAIGWLVVSRMLIGPLRDLERKVSAYKPGDIVHAPAEPPGRVSAYEIGQLGESFQSLTQMVANHEAELAEGLARQTKLTREVHHRVKNNLQVIASLISLHARGQRNPEVIRAYASIQRRVDALAVVHRNHYAELEANRGVSLRALIGEIARNFRGSLPEGDAAPAISLDVSPCYSNQDVAAPVAFLVTELLELSLACAPDAPVGIALAPAGEGLARLDIRSFGLTTSPALEERLADRYGRVLEGLSRQLRSPLEHDGASGSYGINVPVALDSEDKSFS